MSVANPTITASLNPADMTLSVVDKKDRSSLAAESGNGH